MFLDSLLLFALDSHTLNLNKHRPSTTVQLRSLPIKLNHSSDISDTQIQLHIGMAVLW